MSSQFLAPYYFLNLNLEFEFQIVEHKVRRKKGDFRRDFGGGACGQGDFRRRSRGDANKMSESSDRESHDPPVFGGEDTESAKPS
ncbi:unnamed protein product [Prunus armeniaca]|uniref:Uncharacterized protein n=1 Tax=Prunus armeniaca TaxID=36596 RepID=A0A6J5VM32_PRUAR|nr:unnamed protein product [Prunus armeniaca]